MTQATRKIKDETFFVIYIVLMFVPLTIFSFGLFFTEHIESIDIYAFDLSLVFVYIFSIVSWYLLHRNKFILYLLFLTYAFLSGAGQSVLHLFNYNDFGFPNIYIDYSRDSIIKMISYQGIGIVIMHSFAMISSSLKLKTKPQGKVNLRYSEDIFLKLIFYFSYSYQVFILFQWWILRQNLSYAEFYDLRNVQSGYIYGVFFISMIIYFLRNLNSIKKLGFLSLLLGFQIVLLLIVGSRTGVIAIISAYLFLVLVTDNPLRRRISFTKLLIVVILLGYLLSLAFELRNYEISVNNLKYFLTLRNNGFFYFIGKLVQEMGLTSRTIIVTINQVNFNGAGGDTLFFDLLNGFIPIQLLNIFGLHEPEIGNLSTWITEISGSSSGWGYSFIAESYFNFKFFGFIFLALYGYIIVYLEKKAIHGLENRKLLFPAITVYLLANQIFYARAHFGLITSKIRISIYIAIIVFIYIKTTRRKVEIKL